MALAIALALAVAALAPHAWLVRATARRLADGSQSLLEPHQIGRLRGLLAVLSATVGLVLASTFLFRQRFYNLTGWLATGFRGLRRDLRSDIASSWAEARLSVLAATVVGAGLRLLRIGRPIDFDEATTALFYGSRTLLDAVTRYDVPNNHVLHSVLATVTVAVLGDGEAALRMPAFLAGVALIPTAAWVGFRLGGVGASRVVAWLVAVWPSIVIYGALARGYSIAALFTLVALGLVAYEARSKRMVIIALAGVCLGLAVWTVPVAALGAVAVGAYMFLSYGRSKTSVLSLAVLTGVSAAVAVVCYAPIWLVQGWAPLLGNEFVSRGQAPDARAEWIDFAIEVTRLNGLPLWGLAALIGALLVTAATRFAKDPTPARLVAAALASVLLLTSIPMRPVPARSLTIVAPLLLLSVACLASGRRAGRTVSVLAAAGLVAFSLVVTTLRAPWLRTADPETPKELAAAVAAAAQYHEQGYRLVMDASEALVDPARYYARRVGMSFSDIVPILDASDFNQFAPGTPLLLLTYPWSGRDGHGRHVRSYLQGLGPAAEATTVQQFGEIQLVALVTR